MISVRIGPDDAGCRLDRFLRTHCALKSLGEIYQLIRKARVKVNGRKQRQNYRLAIDDVVNIDIVEAEFSGARKRTGEIAQLADTSFFRRNFRLLYEDDELLVCDKPPNLVVHSGTKHARHDSLIELATSYMLCATRGRLECAPILAHRLDKDTSGVILIAKNKRTVRALNESMRSRAVRKTYVALCHGVPRPGRGVISLSLSRDYERNHGTKVRVDRNGQESRSSYRVLRSCGPISKVALELHTGRTHQIRVHMAHIGHPLVGDVRYGDRALDDQIFTGNQSSLRRLYLHAEHISLPHPFLHRQVSFDAPEPAEFVRLCEVVRRGVA